MCGFEDRLKRPFFSQKGCLGWTPPPRGVTKNFPGQNNIKNEFNTIKLLRVQIFSKIWQLLKNHYHRGIFLTFWGAKSPPKGELEFLVHNTDTKSLRARKSNICEKNHQNLMRGFEDIGSIGHFQQKRGFWGQKTPLGGWHKKLFGSK